MGRSPGRRAPARARALPARPSTARSPRADEREVQRSPRHPSVGAARVCAMGRRSRRRAQQGERRAREHNGLQRRGGQRPHAARRAERRHAALAARPRRQAGRLGRGPLAAPRGVPVRAARGALGDRRPAARRPEGAARPLPPGELRANASASARRWPSTWPSATRRSTSDRVRVNPDIRGKHRTRRARAAHGPPSTGSGPALVAAVRGAAKRPAIGPRSAARERGQRRRATAAPPAPSRPARPALPRGGRAFGSRGAGMPLGPAAEQAALHRLRQQARRAARSPGWSRGRGRGRAAPGVDGRRAPVDHLRAGLAGELLDHAGSARPPTPRPPAAARSSRPRGSGRRPAGAAAARLAARPSGFDGLSLVPSGNTTTPCSGSSRDGEHPHPLAARAPLLGVESTATPGSARAGTAPTPPRGCRRRRARRRRRPGRRRRDAQGPAATAAVARMPAVSFPTIEFAAFFVVVFILSWALMPHPRAWRPFILVASYVFYGWLDWRWVLLLVGSTLVNTFAAQVIARSPSQRTRKRALIAAIVFDLGLLCVFKYLGFFVSEVDDALDSIGLGSPLPLLADRAADRHLVLHLPGDLLRRRRLPRRDQGRLARRRGDPAGLLPAPRGRPDRARQRAAAAAAHPARPARRCWPARRCS